MSVSSGVRGSSRTGQDPWHRLKIKTPQRQREPIRKAATGSLPENTAPRTFEDLIGQDAMVRTLSNAFQTGRIAQAYMLTGVRGVGKTTTARLIARALNYTRSGRRGRPYHRDAGAWRALRNP